MAEVVVQNGKGQAAKLGTLLKRINDEHRACRKAQVDALDHALTAGKLLIQVKDEVGHGNWIPWVEDNFDGTVRTAQVYKQLAERCALVEELKAQSATHLSIAGALRGLAPQAFEPIPVPGAPLRPSPEQEAIDRAKAAKKQRLMRKAEFALRTGNLAPPADLTTEEANKWGDAVYEAQRGRGAHLETLLDVLAHQLHILPHHTDPEKVGHYLTEPTNNREVNEDRAAILEEYRAGLSWLTAVLEVAEQEQARMQNPE